MNIYFQISKDFYLLIFEEDLKNNVNYFNKKNNNSFLLRE